MQKPPKKQQQHDEKFAQLFNTRENKMKSYTKQKQQKQNATKKKKLNPTLS